MRIRRNEIAPALLGLACLAGLPGVADAQLFPNLPNNKRQRPDCAFEKPMFGLYRNQYYGYYPTCWRRFPAGWGCPSPEAPNWEAELARTPLEVPETAMGEDPGDGNLDAGPGGLEGGNIPALPDARSPFELDSPAGGPPAGAANPAAAPPTTSPFERAPDPFELPGPGGGEAPRPSTDTAPDPAPATTAPPPATNSAALAPLPDIDPPTQGPDSSVYLPGSDLPPPALAPSPSDTPATPTPALAAPDVNPIPSPAPELRRPVAGRSPASLISPAMRPPTSAELLGGIPGHASPITIDGSLRDAGAPIGFGDPAATMGPIVMPGESVELPGTSAPRGGRIRNFFSGILYGRGLRR